MYMLAYGGNPRNPRHPVDFVDFVDIFHKSLKLLCFLLIHGVDILWIFSWTRIYPWIFLLRTRPPKTFQNGNSSEIHGRHCWIYYRPTLARKKSLTTRGESASSRKSLSTDSAFFAAGCCDSRGPFFAEKVSKHDFGIKIQVRKYFRLSGFRPNRRRFSTVNRDRHARKKAMPRIEGRPFRCRKDWRRKENFRSKKRIRRGQKQNISMAHRRAPERPAKQRQRNS